MKLIFYAAICFLCSCDVMKKMNDGVFILQRTPVPGESPYVDSILIVANGNSATQQIMDDIIPIFQKNLHSRGVTSEKVFVSYSDRHINEKEFDNRNYNYVLWIYEQDRALQQLENSGHLIPLAIKLTDINNEKNIWIATSVVNNLVRTKFYKQRYAGTLAILFRANGIVK